MNVTGFWSYALPQGLFYDDHLISIRDHLQNLFNHEVLIIDKFLLSATANVNSQEMMTQLLEDHLPEQMQLFYQQMQHGNFPNFFTPHYNRKMDIYRRTGATASGTGGGLLHLSTEPHHKQLTSQHIVQPHPHNIVTCPSPISQDTFFVTSTSADFESQFITIPTCPDTALLHPAEQMFDKQILKQISTNLNNKFPIFENIPEITNGLIHLDELERWLTCVTASLGGEILRGNNNLVNFFCAGEGQHGHSNTQGGHSSHSSNHGFGNPFSTTHVQSFNLTKDMVVYLPGNNIIMSIGLVSATQTVGRAISSLIKTTTVVVEMEIVGFNHLQLDPLVFHRLFDILHPLSHKFMWSYPNTPFGATIPYTLHDLCATSEKLVALKELYVRYIHPGVNNENQLFAPMKEYIYTTNTSSSSSTTTNSAGTVVGKRLATDDGSDSDDDVLLKEHIADVEKDDDGDDKMDLIGNISTLAERDGAFALSTSTKGNEDMIRGLCVLPAMEGHLFHHYNLTSAAFHQEHFMLMLIHLFLHPHHI